MQPENITDLKEKIKSAWMKIDQKSIENAINHKKMKEIYKKKW